MHHGLYWLGLLAGLAGLAAAFVARLLAASTQQ